MTTDRSPYQLFPDLADDEYQALKQDIAEHGVMVPVEYDDNGEILDGHHRVRAWTELAYEGTNLATYPRIVREGLTEQEKRAHVRRLNILRRHLTREQCRTLIADQVRETPERSSRQIAGSLGVSHHTVEAVRDDLEATGQIAQSAERQGADGRVINTANIGRRDSSSDDALPPGYTPEAWAYEQATATVEQPEDDDEPTVGDLIEDGFVLPPRGLDPHRKAWYAALSPSHFVRLDPEQVIAMTPAKELETSLVSIERSIDYLQRILAAGRQAVGRARLEIVQ